jgi:cell division protein FtsL
MELIFASLAIIFAIAALVVGIVAIRSMQRVAGQLRALDKKLVQMTSTLEAQEQKVALLESQARSIMAADSMGLAPIAATLANIKKRGVLPTVLMVGFQLFSGAMRKRKALAARNAK